MPPTMSPAQDSEHLLHLATLCVINRHVISGDFNAYSPALGASHMDKRGAEIESFIDNEELTVLNDGRGTHLKNTGHVTPIDLSLATCQKRHSQKQET
jgi:Endonuclease-reverse transcriptase